MVKYVIKEPKKCDSFFHTEVSKQCIEIIKHAVFLLFGLGNHYLLRKILAIPEREERKTSNNSVCDLPMSASQKLEAAPRSPAGLCKSMSP